MAKFIQTLYLILQEEEYIETITWTIDGKGFTILNPKEFQNKVMEQYFNTRNIQSFYRQLLNYGFKMVRMGRGQKVYSNQFFQRNNNSWLLKIKKKIKKQVLNPHSILSNEQFKIEIQELIESQNTMMKQLQNQASLMQKITEMITKQIQIINLTSDETWIIKESQKSMHLFFQILKGYRSDIAVDIAQPLQELCQPITPLSQYETPKQFYKQI